MSAQTPQPFRQPMVPTADHIRGLFHRHDLRCTRQREALYAALASTPTHPTAEDLHQAIHATDPGLSLATVYNTLEAFTACGLARKIACSQGPSRYDADTTDHAHLASSDGQVADVPLELSRRLLASVDPAVLREIETQMGVRVTGLSVQVLTAQSSPSQTEPAAE